MGFCTFDSNVHYYNLKAGLSQPQMLVVPDHADPLVPVPDDLLVNLSESRAVVDALLESLAQASAEVVVCVRADRQTDINCSIPSDGFFPPSRLNSVLRGRSRDMEGEINGCNGYWGEGGGRKEFPPGFCAFLL